MLMYFRHRQKADMINRYFLNIIFFFFIGLPTGFLDNSDGHLAVFFSIDDYFALCYSQVT